MWAAVDLDIRDHIRDGEPERGEEKPFRVVREAFLESSWEENKAGGDCSRDAYKECHVEYEDYFPDCIEAPESVRCR